MCLTGLASIADVVALADRRDQVSVSQGVDRGGRACARVGGRAEHPICHLRPNDRRRGQSRHSVAVRRSDYGMRLLRSHAVDAGDPLDDQDGSRDARGAAHSAVRARRRTRSPRSWPGSRRCSTRTRYPNCCQYASIGTGDLAPLAGTALTLIGERPAIDAVDTDGSHGGPTARCRS